MAGAFLRFRELARPLDGRAAPQLSNMGGKGGQGMTGGFAVP